MSSAAQRRVATLVAVVLAFAAWPVEAMAATTADREAAVVLVVDSSGSLDRGALPRAVAVAESVLAGMDTSSLAAVVQVATRASLVAALGVDRTATVEALKALGRGGDTALYDGLVLAADVLADHDGPGVVVVFSDGIDTTSTANGAAASAALLAGRARVVAVPPPGTDLGRNLADVVGATSGRIVVDLDAATAGAAVLAVVDTPDRATPTPPAVATTVPRPLAPPAAAPASPPSTLLAIGALAVFAALLLAGTALFAPRPQGAALLRRHDRRAALAELGATAAELADRLIRRGSRAHALDRALENAGLQLRAGEFVAATAGVAAVAGMAGATLGGLRLGVLMVLATPFGARVFVTAKTARRRERFADQLGDTLQLLAGSLRAGHGIMQAIDAVARDAEAPTSEEFGRLVVEHRLGRDLQECLWAMAERVDHQDFTWVAQALAIQREVGGDLVEVLDTVAATVRDRARLRRQVKTLSAEGRISAQILFLLPIAVAGIIRFTNPAYFRDLVGTGLGRTLLAVGGLLLLTGGVWMRRIVRPVF